MTGARYGALGVLNDERTVLAQFITVGLNPDEMGRFAVPTGVANEGRPIGAAIGSAPRDRPKTLERQVPGQRHDGGNPALLGC